MFNILQKRGWPHWHCLLWIDGAPQIPASREVSEELKAEIADFLRDKISCALPDPNSAPVLHDLVTRLQLHRHSSSCLRKTKKPGFSKTYCRYDFPRPATTTTVVNDPEKVVKSRENKGRKLRFVQLPRAENEVNINNYNPPLLLATRSNNDIQYILDPSFALLHYICKYVSKAEWDNTQEMSRILEGEGSVRSKLYKLAFAQFRQREVGAIEAADSLFGFPVKGMSRTVAWVSIGTSKEDRIRRMKSLKEIKRLAEIDPNSADLAVANMLDDFYPNRHEDLEDQSLFEIVANFSHKPQPGPRSESYQCHDGHGYFVKVQKPRIPNWYRYNRSDPESLERNARSTVLLFVPWRDENAFLTEETPTWSAVYQSPAVQEVLKKKGESVLAAVRVMEENEEQRRRWEAEAVEEAERDELNPEEVAEAEARAAETGVGHIPEHSVERGLVDRLKLMRENSEQWLYLEYILENLEHQSFHLRF